MSSVVYCIHHKEGCKWTDELRKLKVSPPPLLPLPRAVCEQQSFVSLGRGKALSPFHYGLCRGRPDGWLYCSCYTQVRWRRGPAGSHRPPLLCSALRVPAQFICDARRAARSLRRRRPGGPESGRAELEPPRRRAALGGALRSRSTAHGRPTLGCRYSHDAVCQSRRV